MKRSLVKRFNKEFLAHHRLEPRTQVSLEKDTKMPETGANLFIS